MNPWNIIGWICLALICLPLLLWGMILIVRVLLAIGETLGDYRRYRKTRNVAPSFGQRWNQNGSILEIGQRHPAGHFTVTSRSCGSSLSFGSTDEEWKERVRNRKLFLVSE